MLPLRTSNKQNTSAPALKIEDFVRLSSTGSYGGIAFSPALMAAIRQFPAIAEDYNLLTSGKLTLEAKRRGKPVPIFIDEATRNYQEITIKIKQLVRANSKLSAVIQFNESKGR